jgi:hypothetical protein
VYNSEVESLPSLCKALVLEKRTRRRKRRKRRNKETGWLHMPPLMGKDKLPPKAPAMDTPGFIDQSRFMPTNATRDYLCVCVCGAGV